MKLRKAFCLGLALASLSFGNAQAASNPSCILMKFTDDTRFDKIESAVSLSDLVMEKLVNSGKFNLKETRPIDSKLEALLYDEKAQELEGVRQAMLNGNYSAMFEGAGFNEKKAQSIATASVGQFISPKIISKIGIEHGAEYLLQGTIINLGTGDWWDEDTIKLSEGLRAASGLAGSNFCGSTLGVLGSVSMERTGVGVQSDLRIIKASTGEVVWNKRFTGIGDQKQYGVGLITIGSSTLTSELYAKAMDRVAEKMVNALLEDLQNNQLFL